MKSKNPEINPAEAEARIKQFYKRVKHNIRTCSFIDKRYALDALGIPVVATDEKLEVKISVPLEFTPIEKVSEHTLISGKKYRKRALNLQTIVAKPILIVG
jgi:hypothetical protein